MFAAGGGAGAGAEKSSSSIPKRSTTGAGAGAGCFAAATGVGAVLERAGGAVLLEFEIEFDRRVATVSSSPASYSS